MTKNLLNRSLLIMIMIAAMSMSAWAQGPRYSKGGPSKQANAEMRIKAMIPDLSDDQIAKIKVLRIAMMKQITPLRAQMKEKRAHLNTLSLAEKPDTKAINATIDEIGALRVKMMKIRAQFRQDMRALLTDDQRVIFDSKAGHMMKRGFYHSGPASNCPRAKRP